MKIINKFFVFLTCLSISCKTHIENRPENESFSIIQPDIYYKNNNHTDIPYYHVFDTIENGKKVTIISNGDLETKITEKGVLNYIDGNLISNTKDTLINGLKKSYEEKIDRNERLIIIFDKKKSVKEYESIYKYINGKLLLKVIVVIDKNMNFIEIKTNFDDKGEMISKLERKYKSNQYRHENQNNEITEYYKFGKKFQWSKLVYIESKTNEEKRIIRLEELNYYNLKNELIKKEYIKDTYSLYQELFSSEPAKIIQKIEVLKTEYYQKNKLIKVE